MWHWGGWCLNRREHYDSHTKSMCFRRLIDYGVLGHALVKTPRYSLHYKPVTNHIKLTLQLPLCAWLQFDGHASGRPIQCVSGSMRSREFSFSHSIEKATDYQWRAGWSRQIQVLLYLAPIPTVAKMAFFTNPLAVFTNYFHHCLHLY